MANKPNLVLLSRQEWEDMPRNGYEIRNGEETFLMVVEGAFYLQGQVDELMEQKLSGASTNGNMKPSKQATNLSLEEINSRVRNTIKSAGPLTIQQLIEKTLLPLGRVRGLIASSKYSTDFRKNRSGQWELR